MVVDLCAFAKFGKEEHILDLFENGTVYCNTLETFQNLEDKFRGDKWEGTSNLRNYKGSEITRFEIQPIDKSFPPIQLKPLNLQLREFYKEIKANMYSLYVVKTEDVLKLGSYKIHADNSQFGSHFVLIYDVQRFLDMLTGELNIQNYTFHHGLVEYFDPTTYNGELTLFDKRNIYSYQNELRFLINNTKVEPIKIKIGSLKGIAKFFKTKRLNDIEMRPK